MKKLFEFLSLFGGVRLTAIVGLRWFLLGRLQSVVLFKQHVFGINLFLKRREYCCVETLTLKSSNELIPIILTIPLMEEIFLLFQLS